MPADYLIMVHWSEASWDSPPGSGYLTGALLLISGLAVVIMTMVSRPWPAPRTDFALEDVAA